MLFVIMRFRLRISLFVFYGYGWGGGGCDIYVLLKFLFIVEFKLGKRMFNGRIRILIYLKNQGFEYFISSLFFSNFNFCMIVRLRWMDKKWLQIFDYD